jgi:hypothetical protein
MDELLVYKINFFSLKDNLIIGSSIGDIHVINTKNKFEEKYIKYHKSAIFEIQFDELLTARQIRSHPIKYTGWPGFRIDFLAKKMMPNKFELQWLVPISNEAQIDPVVSQISTKIQEIKNLEGSTI